MAVRGSIGSSVEPNIIDQLNIRQDIFGNENKSRQDLIIINQNTAWIQLRSSVNKIVEGDADKAAVTLEEAFILTHSPQEAQNFILTNGTRNTNEGQVRSGINRDLTVPLDLTKAYNNEGELGFRPMAGITGLSVRSKNTYGTLMEAEVKFNVWSVEDLERCELLYFRPGYTSLLEWGHSVFVDNSGNLQQFGKTVHPISDRDFFTSVKKTAEDVDNLIEQKRTQYDGNYDAMFGFITNFSFSFRSDGGYDCSVKIVSRGVILENLKPPTTSDDISAKEEDEKEEEIRYLKSPYHWLFYHLEEDTDINEEGGEFSLLNQISEVSDKVPNFVSRLPDIKVFQTDMELAGGGWFFGLNDKKIKLQYIRIGDFISIINAVNSLLKQDPDKPGLDLFIPYPGVTFNTFPDHYSVDPIVGVPPGYPEYQSTLSPGTAFLNWTRELFNTVDIDKRQAATYAECRIYRDDLHDKMKAFARQSGDQNLNFVENIFISTFFIEKTLDTFLDGGELSGTGIYDFLKQVLRGVNNALGNINDFDLFYDHVTNKYMVVDRNGVVPQDRLPTVNMTGLRNTVSNLDISSTISSQIASQVAIAAQGNTGNIKENLATILEWNKGAIDRFIPIKSTSTSKNEKEKEDKRLSYFKNLRKVYLNFNDRGDFGSWFTDQKYNQDLIEQIRSEAYADIQRLSKNYRYKEGLNPPGVVPVELSFTMIGIHGLKIGTVFKINRGLLPSKYNNWAYIVTGLEQSFENNKWLTTVKTQFFPDRSISPQERQNRKTEQQRRTGSGPTPVTNSTPGAAQPAETVQEFVGETPNADRLRQVLTELGYFEKGRELSNGGDIQPKTAETGIAVMKKLKERVPNITVTMTGGNDRYHQQLPYKSRHSQGLGLDFVFSPANSDTIPRVKEVLQSFAAGNQPQFSFLDEYSSPTAKATARHFHFSWREGGGTEGLPEIKQAIALARQNKIPKFTV
jgi:hypothetical protein